MLKLEYQVIIKSTKGVQLNDFKNPFIEKIKIKKSKNKNDYTHTMVSIKLNQEMCMPIEILKSINDYLSKNNSGYCEIVCSYSEINLDEYEF